MRVQAFGAELAIEGFDEGIVCGFAWPGEVEGDTALVSQQVHAPRDDLAALIHPDRLRVSELVPTCISPYRPAAHERPHLGGRTHDRT